MIYQTVTCKILLHPSATLVSSLIADSLSFASSINVEMIFLYELEFFLNFHSSEMIHCKCFLSSLYWGANKCENHSIAVVVVFRGYIESFIEMGYVKSVNV